MEWINYKDEKPPVDGKQFLALLKGQFALCQWHTDEDKLYFNWLPADHAGFEIDEEFQRKLTHWVKLELPKDY